MPPITKADIGLSNVLNFAPASMAESTGSLTNRVMTPVTTNYAIDSKLVDANENIKGLIRTNTGTQILDDEDPYKGLVANGLLALINQNNNTFNKIQLAISKLIKTSNITINSVTGSNQILAVSTPVVGLSNINSIFTFIASQPNTGNVTFTLNSETLPVTLWNSDQVLSGYIKANVKYALMPFNNRLVLLNPTIPIDNSYIDNKVISHLNESNPHSQYLTESSVKTIYDLGFKGSYIGDANLVGNEYNCSLANITVTAGIFAIKFIQNNVFGNTLNINGIVKLLKDSKGLTLQTNEITAGEIRVIINTTDSYIVHSVKTNNNSGSLDAINQHMLDPDPHPIYWNDIRGSAFINIETQNRIASDNTINLAVNTLSGNVGNTQTNFLQNYIINKT